jgi:AcrR family transcriptional regulator
MSKEDILLAAAQIFSEKGFHATSMQDIAEAVNIKKASLYHHIESKQELLVDLLDQSLYLLIEMMQNVTDLSLPPEVKLRRAISEYFETLVEYREISTVMLLEHRSLEPKYRTRHIPLRDRFEQLWRGIIVQGIEEGVFACEHPGLVVKELMGVINWTIMWYKPSGPLSSAEIAEHCSDVFINGLCVRNGE